MTQRLKIDLPIIVEGRYDKAALSGYIDGVIITTGGFSVFNNKEKQALIRKISSGGVILLTDSDGGGIQIRSFLTKLVPKEKIHNLYIPKIEGKEKRKTKPSKAGTLGVEGMKKDVILRLLTPFASGNEPEKDKELTTKVDFYLDGLSGGSNATLLRDKLAAELELPSGMTANALLEAVNLLVDREEYKRIVERIKTDEE